ncbi:MAG TPA: glucan 1,4-alpha-glucosidase [Candidatus Limnocylindrales bacterium]|nr:glucan 1,4-alpha-glucosidase [Candidatus Limnocylindrales bacterium]
MASTSSSPSTGSAFGHPGIPPTWSSSSKDGIGTAYATSSRVWFTLAQGIVTEIYYPTIDRPQIRDAQFLVTDGKTFFHEEKRDLTAAVERIEAHALGYRVASADPQGRYRLEKEIISDPHQACVLLRARLTPAEGWAGKLRLFFLLAPHLEVAGGNNSARKLEIAGRNMLLAWKNSTCLAVDADRGFARSSCGFVGHSDGWQDLNDNYAMDWEFDRAEDGNVAMMGEIDLAQGSEFTIAMAFGDSVHAAAAVINQSLAFPFEEHKSRFVDQWQRTCETLHKLDHLGSDGGQLYRTSRTVLLAHEDKTFAGAFIASASIPWGEVMGDEDLGGYHLVWVRDMVNTATGLLAAADKVTPLRALVYLACSQQSDGGFPQNFWIDGTPYWKGIQLDEVAFPIMLAWRLWKADALALFDPYPMVKAAARYLVQQGPVTEQERWEEASGYSPSTLAAAIAALICAADFARSRGEGQIADFLQEHADFIESHVERWTVTTQGSLVPGISRHYIRILPVGINDPSPLEDPNTGSLTLANRPPGEQYAFPAKDIVDAGFLELVRYGIRPAGSALMEDSLRVIDSLLKVETPFGPAWRRYNNDGYGPHVDGRPYQGWGTGRAWPLLTGERAHYELAAGRDIGSYVAAMERFATQGGMLPEQVWDQPDIPAAGMYLGRPAGSATPLMWAHAEYIKLLRSLNDGAVFDLIPAVANRYLAALGRKDLEVWKPSRRVRSVPSGSTLRVMSPGEFRLRWSAADGDFHESLSTESGLGLGFVDIPTQEKQSAPLRFAFAHSDSGQPDDTLHEVQVNPIRWPR